MTRRLPNPLTVLSLLSWAGAVVMWRGGDRLTAYSLALLGLLLLWLRSLRASYEFCHYGTSTGLVLTVSWGQVRLYRNQGGPPNETTGFVRRVRTFAPSFDPRRSPMDHVYWGWAGFGYAFGENTRTHARYRLASVPMWALMLLLALAAFTVAQ